MELVTGAKELIRLAEKGRLKAVRTSLWNKGDWYGKDERYPVAFAADMVEFYIETLGLRTTWEPRKTKNFVFFTE